MRRFIPWILLLLSVAIVVVALVEIDSRQEEEGEIAAPTGVPSPTFTFPAQTTQPAATPLQGTPPGGQTGQVTPGPATPGPTFVPATPVPSTPAPAPGGEVQATGPTPVTGGGAVSGGLLVLALAGAFSRLGRR